MDLILTTSQKLLMSQKMLQSTEILQMSSAELVDYIKEISVENPIVDYEEKNESEEKFDLLRRKLDFLDSSDEQNRTYYSDDKEDEGNNDDWKFKGYVGESLEEYLLEQLNVSSHPKPLCCVARYIVCSINQNGYLNESADEIATALSLPLTTVEEALALVQSFEPPGVGARNLKECLLLQLHRNNIQCDLAEQIIDQCLEMVGKNQLHLIAKKLKACQTQVLDAVQLIKTLNPKPGNSFDQGKGLEYITPDAIIHKGLKGYEIILNDKFFPNIGINSYYKTMMDKDDDGKTKEYIFNKIKQAEWIMTCISKRNATLTKTLETIVAIQKDFFDKGVGHIKPMCLNDVATSIGMHESTVSRTAKQKYLQCQHGVFPLSYFFQTNATTGSDLKMTPERIKLTIKEIVDKENPDSPLSDREITEKLTEKGIDISRRTVAKYREAIGILGTSGRKA